MQNLPCASGESRNADTLVGLVREASNQYSGPLIFRETEDVSIMRDKRACKDIGLFVVIST